MEIGSPHSLDLIFTRSYKIKKDNENLLITIAIEKDTIN
jgi:hypothetical protein